MAKAFQKNDATDAARAIWNGEVHDVITERLRVPYDAIVQVTPDWTRNLMSLTLVSSVSLTDAERDEVANTYAATPELLPLALEARTNAKHATIREAVASVQADLTRDMPKRIAAVKAAHSLAIVARDLRDELATMAEYANDPRGAYKAFAELLSAGCVADAFGTVYQQARVAAK